METSLSFWEKNTYLSNIDVAVIGSGIVGLNAAIHLKKRHKKLKVVILDKGLLSMGASSRNAGFCCFGSPGELLDDLKSQSEEKVFSLVERRWKGLQRLHKNLGDRAIDFHNWGGYEVFDSEKEYQLCAEKLSYLNKHISPLIGIKTVYKDASDQIKKFGFKGIKGVLINVAEGQIDTGKMMSALIAKAYQEGVYIINMFEVAHIEDQNDSVLIRSKDGAAVTSKRVLICTNGFSKPLLPGYPVEPHRAQVLITKPIPKLKLKGAFHYDKGYYYFRNVGDRILLGGGRNLDFKTENTDQYGLTDIVQNRLNDLLHKIIAPYAQPEVDIRWSGILGLGDEKTPIIKPVSKNVFCAIRMGGMGVAIGSLVGEEAAEMVGETL